MNALAQLGNNLRQARKRRFPHDDMKAFALRVGISRATLQKMEQGDLSVALASYYRAAQVLELAAGFERLFEQEESLFDGE